MALVSDTFHNKKLKENSINIKTKYITKHINTAIAVLILLKPNPFLIHTPYLLLYNNIYNLIWNNYNLYNIMSISIFFNFFTS